MEGEDDVFPVVVRDANFGTWDGWSDRPALIGNFGVSVDMTIGYSQVSTEGRNPSCQIRAIEATGCEKIFTGQCSGRWESRSQLDEALGSMRKDDTFVVWKGDRPARSLKHLIDLAS